MVKVDRRSRIGRAVPRPPRILFGVPALSTHMTSIVDKILVISAALEDQRLPYALGGALALAFCTERARGPIDIDVNVFVGQDEAARVLSSVCPPVRHSDEDRRGPPAGRAGPSVVGNDARRRLP